MGEAVFACNICSTKKEIILATGRKMTRNVEVCFADMGTDDAEVVGIAGLQECLSLVISFSIPHQCCILSGKETIL